MDSIEVLEIDFPVESLTDLTLDDLDLYLLDPEDEEEARTEREKIKKIERELEDEGYQLNLPVIK